jgi:hypothetical protein
MPKTISNKTTRADSIRKVKAGLQKYYASTPLVLAGTTYAPSALQAFLQTDIDVNDTSTQARANWLHTVAVARDTDTKTDPVLRAIRAQVQSQYGEAPNAETVLADFGLAPRKKAPQTVATKAVAVAKNKATRTARNTMGPKAKAKVKGVLPATGGTSPPKVSTTPGPTGSNSTSTGSPSASPSGTTNPSHP